MDATSQMHILAVDDSVVDRKVLERLLKNSSFRGKQTSEPLMQTILIYISFSKPSLNPPVGFHFSDDGGLCEDCIGVFRLQRWEYSHQGSLVD